MISFVVNLWQIDSDICSDRTATSDVTNGCNADDRQVMHNLSDFMSDA